MMETYKRQTLAILLFLLLDSAATFGQEPAQMRATQPTLVKSESEVTVTVGDELFTKLVFDGYPRPILYPVLAAGKIPMTRGYPLEKLPGEETDHPHHKSIWFAHGDVNGTDFWTEKGVIRNVSTKVEADFPTSVRLVNHWMKGEIRECEETTVYTFSCRDHLRWIDLHISLVASDRDVKFGDTKEGLMAVRVHPGLRLTPDPKQGVTEVFGSIINSEGDSDGKAWGQAATWVRYDGRVPSDGQADRSAVAIVLMDHPQNFRHPTTWHARDYGLMAANPFGLHDFGFGPKGTGDFILPKGEALRFRYRILFANLELGKLDTPAEYALFAQSE